ncbi:hypothetical protein HanIR_Chr06g0260371 [Helianthus annuus]|nr:hypothetical protein HanIR_Chr06g0260371 [Helianthus annuus]
MMESSIYSRWFVKEGGSQLAVASCPRLTWRDVTRSTSASFSACYLVVPECPLEILRQDLISSDWCHVTSLSSTFSLLSLVVVHSCLQVCHSSF